MDIFDALTLTGGLSLFLFGMSIMGQALERRAGGQLRFLLEKLTSGKLAGLLTGLSKQTLHSAVHKLEREGVLLVEASGAKNKRLRFTEAGRQLAACTAAQLMAAENRVLAGWRPEEAELYLALTQRYLDEMKKELAKLKPPSAMRERTASEE